MNGRDFARQRALITWRARSEAHRRKAMARLIRQAGAVVVFVSGKLVGYRLPDGFVVCEKRRYRTESAALLELANVQLFTRLNGPRRIPIRAYQCTHCHGWHLTSQREAA
ncbi:hypothetical protein [Microvirga alba]|uniref:Uncharacterized protein n=1 Tax=Microvirga alba TaxID=2791025 RepID=A0A931BZA9_9HYPH|nr:hypothetical protein [Microvirga alba]MBF9235562.1 hypothetical protein [Microvirga alba]